MSRPLLLQTVLGSVCLPTLQRYTTALCTVRTNWRLASLLLQELRTTYLEANDFSFSATISAYEKAAAGLPVLRNSR